MIRDDDNGIVLGEIVEWSTDHVQVVVTAMAYGWEGRVVVCHESTFFPQEFDDCQRWRLAQVVYISLIG